MKKLKRAFPASGIAVPAEPPEPGGAASGEPPPEPPVVEGAPPAPPGAPVLGSLPPQPMRSVEHDARHPHATSVETVRERFMIFLREKEPRTIPAERPHVTTTCHAGDSFMRRNVS
jgi:hypothetical protein